MILVWTVENGRKTHQSENDAKISQVRVFVDPFVACACNSIVYERFIRKRITMIVWTRIDRCVFNESLMATKVSTGPETNKEQTNGKKKI